MQEVPLVLLKPWMFEDIHVYVCTQMQSGMCVFKGNYLLNMCTYICTYLYPGVVKDQRESCTLQC